MKMTMNNWKKGTVPIALAFFLSMRDAVARREKEWMKLTGSHRRQQNGAGSEDRPFAGSENRSASLCKTSSDARTAPLTPPPAPKLEPPEP
jgi:hypothetical protein